MKIIKFQVNGKVVHAISEKPVPNLKVEAWDKDIKYNDLLGQTFTDLEGNFEIEFDSTYFREHAPDAKPDLLFKVFLGKRLLSIANDKVISNAGERTEVTLRVLIPEMTERGKDRISMQKALEISAFLQQSDFKGLMGQVKETVNSQFAFFTDMIKNSVEKFDFSPIKTGENQSGNIVGQDVKAAGAQLHSQQVTVNEVKKYEPGLNRKSFSDLLHKPVNLKAGQKIDLYEENGKVRYYTIVKDETAAPAAMVKAEAPELKKMEEELEATRQLAAAREEKIGKLELEMEQLKKDHSEIRALLQSENMAKLMKQLTVAEQPAIKKRVGKVQ